MRFKNFIIIAALTLALTGCKTTDNTLSYFRNLGDSESGVMPQGTGYEIKIVPEDELSILVSSSVPEATAMFNQPQANTARRGEMSTQINPRLQTYIVNKDGDIVMPVIGRLNVAGKTTREIEQMIVSRVSPTVNDPFVRVELIGFYINVMGEVKNPHRVYVNSERFTLLDALSAAGDLTEFGERSNVMVIREENGQQVYHRLNLADTNIFSSPYFYLKQNDVIYVEPNQIRIDNSKYNQNNAYKLTVISTVVSAASVIASLIIAVAVK
ncbi:MAG: polysaccharide biosynthesis/export family protein [Muribaculaceae bacterium]|nr:polysaccharide biosynthesis/export family protein [Muribaculaceae bacterium]MBR5118974.1 polysaccharide biosynthesis/export family protein [Muribaculaceae bacterium]